MYDLETFGKWKRESRSSGRWGNHLAPQRRKWTALFLADGTRKRELCHVLYILTALLRYNLHSIKFALDAHNSMIISQSTDLCNVSFGSGRTFTPSCSFAPIPTPQLLATTNIPVSIHVPFLDILHMWNSTARGLSGLASFTWHDVFKAYPCCSTCWYFLLIGE